jgi:hypothetical protein
VRPQFMEEAEKLEKELQRYYDVYMEKHRNLDYLEHELDKYRRNEEERMEVSCSFVRCYFRRQGDADMPQLRCHRCTTLSYQFQLPRRTRCRCVYTVYVFTAVYLHCVVCRSTSAGCARCASGCSRRRWTSCGAGCVGPTTPRRTATTAAGETITGTPGEGHCSPTSSCSLARKNLSLTGGSCVIS